MVSEEGGGRERGGRNEARVKNLSWLEYLSDRSERRNFLK